MPLRFNSYYFYIFSLAALFMVVFGTLSHECGHYFTARMVGYEARINYAQAFYNNTDTSDYPFLRDAYARYGDLIKQNKPFPGSEKLKEIRAIEMRNAFLVTLGGPLITMLTGTLFFCIAWAGRYKTKDLFSWIFIFLSLTWLRQCVNELVSLGKYLFTGSTGFSDELSLSAMLNLPHKTIGISTGIIACAVFVLVLFKLVDQPLRFTFFISIAVGGAVGYYLWLHLLGPVIMP